MTDWAKFPFWLLIRFYIILEIVSYLSFSTIVLSKSHTFQIHEKHLQNDKRLERRFERKVEALLAFDQKQELFSIYLLLCKTWSIHILEVKLKVPESKYRSNRVSMKFSPRINKNGFTSTHSHTLPYFFPFLWLEENLAFPLTFSRLA